MKRKRAKATLFCGATYGHIDDEFEWTLRIGRLTIVHAGYYKTKRVATRSAYRAAAKLGLEIVPEKKR